MVSVLIPEGELKLVDNRIMVGNSTWAMTQPITIAVLHPKHFKDENRALMLELLAIVNAARAVKGSDPSEI